MPVRKLLSDVYEVGARDWSRRLFDEVIPLPDGTSYNAYLIKGSEKVALIDAVDPRTWNQLEENLKRFSNLKIDYVISNHAEQDHSGCIPDVLRLYPEAKVVTNAKCKSFLMDLLLIPEDKFIVVEDHQRLPLGGKTLEFIIFPWVHWPETMLTYLIEDKILFSCDLFGAHIADSRLVLKKEDNAEIVEPAKRYFSEIMYPFRSNISNNFQKILDLDIKMIAPSHGLVYEDPDFIINCYKEWISDRVLNKVIIPYVSMHGSTQAIVDYFMNGLRERNIEYQPFNLTVADMGKLAMAITDAATVVVGACAVLGGMHPLVAQVVYLYNLLRPKTRFVSVIASYGWGSKMLEQIQSMLYNLKAEVIPPVLVKGYPKENDFKALDVLLDEIAKRHKSI